MYYVKEYHIAVIKSGVSTFEIMVESPEEIRQILEIGDDEEIKFVNGMYTYNVSETEHWNVLEVSPLLTGVTVSQNEGVHFNPVFTHIMYQGEFYEICQDQADENYIQHPTEGAVYIDPHKEPRIGDFAQMPDSFELKMTEFLEYIEENYTPMGKGIWLSLRNAHQQFTHEQIIENFKNQ